MGGSLGSPTVLAILLIAAPVFAQPPLAEIAREEKERRASISEKSRVYTNDDLLGGLRLTTGTSSAPGGEATETAGDDAAATADQTPPGTDTAQQDEEYWQQRITTAREGRRRAELLVAALQNRVDGLWADFTARDDPLQRAQIEQDRLDAISELEYTRGEIDRYEQETADIQEEARRAGAPAGWLR